MVRMTQEEYEQLQGTQSPETGLTPGLRYIIGIDPGKTTGLAVWDRVEERFAAVESTDFWGCLDFVQNAFTKYETTIIIEDPAQIRTIYDRNRVQDWSKQMKIAQNVGGNKREAELLIEGFRNGGYTVRPVKPTGPKWGAEYCKRVTGYDGTPNNQDVRDALRLCFQQ